ncbi:MAG: single-stranded DNA-binding protein [Acidimicrobiia bacterium]
MDINLAVLCGRLATAPEVRVYDTGSRCMRFLVTVAVERPRRRIDVVPVTLWDPPAHLADDPPEQNARVWVTGVVQRRAHDGPEGRRSRIEVMAEQVTVLNSETVARAR